MSVLVELFADLVGLAGPPTDELRHRRPLPVAPGAPSPSRSVLVGSPPDLPGKPRSGDRAVTRRPPATRTWVRLLGGSVLLAGSARALTAAKWPPVPVEDTRPWRRRGARRRWRAGLRRRARGRPRGDAGRRCGSSAAGTSTCAALRSSMPSVTKTNAVTRRKRERLHPERPARLQAEREVDVELDLLDAAVAQPQRERVPGVDDGCGTGAQVDPQQLAGDELAGRGVRRERVVGVPGLLARGPCRGGDRCAGCRPAGWPAAPPRPRARPRR